MAVSYTTRYPTPPARWSRRFGGRSVPFPAGVNDAEWEVVLDRWADGTWSRYHVSMSDGAVWVEASDGWRMPRWSELPDVVRARVWDVLV